MKRRKEKCETRQRNNSLVAVAAVAQGVEQMSENGNCDTDVPGSTNKGSGLRTSGVTKERYFSPESYWEIRESSEQSDLVLFLRLFRPDCKKLSKPKDEQWSYLRDKILPVTKARVDSKEEEYRARIPAINAQIAELDEVLDTKQET